MHFERYFAENPFKLHKIIKKKSKKKKKNNQKTKCVPTLPKISRHVTLNTLIFIRKNGPIIAGRCPSVNNLHDIL